MTDPNVRRPASQSFPRQRTLHLFALCAFAFTEPLLGALSRQTVYLHDEQFGAVEFGAVLFMLAIVIPAAWLLVDVITRRIAARNAGRGRNTVLFLLSFLVALSLLRPTAQWNFLAEHYFAWMFSLAVALPGAWFFTRAYDRYDGLRSWLTVSAIGIVAFPVSFVWQMQNIQRQHSKDESRCHAETPAPVVMVVFDEFSGTTLMDEHHQVDAVRHPNLARLANSSTWYRQATSVHARTEFAVPAILSGRLPSIGSSPVLADHPGNLLDIIHRSGEFDMSVFEPITRLCPEGLGHDVLRIQQHPVRQAADLLSTLARVYPHLIFPTDIPIEFPEIPKPWFGISKTLLVDWRPLTSGLFHYIYSRKRDVQLDHFLDCIHRTKRPPFAFLHVVLPHYPWTYYPSGQSYTDSNDRAWKPDGGLGELGEDWPNDEALVRRCEHRYLMQVAATDRFVGRLLDKLQETDLFDRCLLIVMADHGVSFLPTRSRRLPDGDNVTDLMSVPLFIKRPGQKVARIDDSNVETIDVFPTVAEELGITLPEPIDGLSVSNPIRRARKTFYFENGMTVLEPHLPNLDASVQRRLEAFQDVSLDRPPRGAISQPEWIGRPLTAFTVEEPPSSSTPAITLSREAYEPVMTDLNEKRMTRLLSGELAAHVVTESPAEVLLAVGGVVYDVSRTFSSASTHTAFSFVIPESAGATEPTEIELFLVKPISISSPTLIRLHHWMIGPNK